jgi:hypothetical protein
MSCTAWYGSVIALAAVGWIANVHYSIHSWSTFTLQQRLDLGALVVFATVALYRAVLPTRYFDRQVWHDTVFSDLLAVRLMALCAELSLAWLVYRMLNPKLPQTACVVAACLLLAQVFATIGTVTPRGWLFAVEESLWTAAAAAAAIVACVASPRLPRRNWIVAVIAVYIAFQAWHLSGLWKKHDAHNSVPFSDTSNTSTDCADYGAEFLVWSAVYFGVMPLLLLGVYRGTRST